MIGANAGLLRGVIIGYDRGIGFMWLKGRMFPLLALFFGIPYGVIAGAGTWMRRGGNYPPFCFSSVGTSLRRWLL